MKIHAFCRSCDAIILSLLALFMAIGCQPKVPPQDPSIQPISVKEPLSRVNIIDHSGLSETITNKERLKELAQRDFISPQPYRKVMRIYTHDKEGSSRSIITSYYENGQVRQYLECLNGRACGLYQEWHPNGQKKLISHVLAGQADIDEKAFSTWAFDGICRAWDDQGALSATINYQHGSLNGPTETFYPTGERKRVTPYENGVKEGEEIAYSKSGIVVQLITFHNGRRQGPSRGYGNDGKESWQEEFHDDHLVSGAYLSTSGDLISSVANGNGIRSSFEDGHLISQEEIRNGVPEGWTTLYEYDGTIERKYEVKNGKKNGTEIRYYIENTKQTPRLMLEWREGILHGTIKTWYPTGAIESQREICQNLKQGLSMAWYPDGSVMLVEEYNDDKLIRGRYLCKGETTPVSTIENGNGTATIFDASGSVIEKIKYAESKPQVD
jgi:antitoxin component YwqK of YwqJK toxin-antitoxin module